MKTTERQSSARMLQAERLIVEAIEAGVDLEDVRCPIDDARKEGGEVRWPKLGEDWR